METYKIWFDDASLFIQPKTGKIISLELSLFPRLAKATITQRENFTLSPFGIHWPELDEDLSFEGLLTMKRKSKPKQEPRLSAQH